MVTVVQAFFQTGSISCFSLCAVTILVVLKHAGYMIPSLYVKNPLFVNMTGYPKTILFFLNA